MSFSAIEQLSKSHAVVYHMLQKRFRGTYYLPPNRNDVKLENEKKLLLITLRSAVGVII